MERKYPPSSRGEPSTPKAEENRRILGRGNENSHITWVPVISLSSTFPSGGKRESQGADNAKDNRNHNENSNTKSWQPTDHYKTICTPQLQVSAFRTDIKQKVAKGILR